MITNIDYSNVFPKNFEISYDLLKGVKPNTNWKKVLKRKSSTVLEKIQKTQKKTEWKCLEKYSYESFNDWGSHRRYPNPNIEDDESLSFSDFETTSVTWLHTFMSWDPDEMFLTFGIIIHKKPMWKSYEKLWWWKCCYNWWNVKMQP